MRLKLFIVILLNIAGNIYLVAQVQSLSPSVISIASSYYDAGSFSLSTTVGELLTETLTNNNNILTQGFQQPDYTDKAPLPPAGQSAMWQCKMTYLYKHAQVGQWSNELTVTVSCTV
jgi:hypothetical protein